MKPIVVLVEPENPRNIGFVARAMYCNELSDLRIVDTSVSKMNREAYITGVSGKDILDSASFYSSLSEATAECTETVGFSRRTFENEPCKLELPNLINELPKSGVTALIFGRESQGLNRDELSFCSKLCAIPIRANMSYNLGQAAAIALYELTGKNDYKTDQKHEQIAPSQKEKETLWKYLRENSNSKYLKRGERENQLRRMVNRLNLDKDELHFFLGIITSLNK